MFGLGGLVRESVDLVAHEMNGSLVLVVQSLVRDGNEESMASVFLVPSIITQFSYLKGLVYEKTLQVQNERLSCNPSMFENEIVWKVFLLISKE